MIAGRHTGQCVTKWTGPGAGHGSHDFTLDGRSERLRSIKILANEWRPTEQLRGNDTQGTIFILLQLRVLSLTYIVYKQFYR